MRIVLLSTTCLCLLLAGCDKAATSNGNTQPIEAMAIPNPRLADATPPPKVRIMVPRATQVPWRPRR